MLLGAFSSGVNVRRSRREIGWAVLAHACPRGLVNQVIHVITAHPSVQRPTLVLLNVVLACCGLTLVGLLFLVGGASPSLLLHLSLVLLLAVVVAAAINWWVSPTAGLGRRGDPLQRAPPAGTGCEGRGHSHADRLLPPPEPCARWSGACVFYGVCLPVLHPLLPRC